MMKLLYGGLSPFVRKAMIVAHEKGVVEKLELVPAPVNPLQPLDLAIAVNPLGKIPALTLDDGTVIYGSRSSRNTWMRWAGRRPSSQQGLQDGRLCGETPSATEFLRPDHWSASKDFVQPTSNGPIGVTSRC